MFAFFDYELHRARAAELQGRAEEHRRAMGVPPPRPSRAWGSVREALRRGRNAGGDAGGSAGPAAPSRDDRPEGGWATAA
jgi:hypothetical protein